jgi:hypothetical protein
MADDASFGPFYNRKHVDLQRRLPPVMDVSGKTIEVKVVEEAGAQSAVIELRSTIENLLTKEGSGVRVEGNSPDLVVDCQITEYNKPAIETKTDGKTTTETITGVLQAVFRITDVRARRIIASGKAERQINQLAGTRANKEETYIPSIPNPFHRPKPGEKNLNSTLDAQNTMIDDVAKQIASYLVTTTETVEASLAVGKALEPANKLATTSLWSRALEDLETVPPYADPRMEAYRLYNIGVANEALGYQAQDSKAAVKYLKEASLDYGKAIADRPDEKYFLEPQNRITTALEHYMPTTKPDPAQAPVVAEKKDDPPVTNEDVIAMLQANMDEANILDNIKNAPKVDFDLSPGAQIKLARSGVKGLILAAMKQRVRGPASAAPGDQASNQPPASTAPVKTQRGTKSQSLKPQQTPSPQPQ